MTDNVVHLNEENSPEFFEAYRSLMADLEDAAIADKGMAVLDFMRDMAIPTNDLAPMLIRLLASVAMFCTRDSRLTPERWGWAFGAALNDRIKGVAYLADMPKQGLH